jgi:hypothetical protein
MDGKLVDGRELRIQEAKERRAENPKEHMVRMMGFFNKSYQLIMSLSSLV